MESDQKANKIWSIFERSGTVADLHSKTLDSCPPCQGPKFFQFHAVFGNFWQNRMLATPGSWRPHLGEILDPPLKEFNFLKTREYLHLLLPHTYFRF